ncbi:hypothetical protein LINGRAPRIM_LOCUS674 [Linum grandiflorum]
MPPRRESRAANHGDDEADLAEFRRATADLRRQVELLTQQLAKSVHIRRHDDDVTVTDDNPFAGHRYHSPERPSHKWEQGFKVEIPTFDGSLQPEEFIDWLSQVEEILDFKEVPEGRRVSLVTIRLRDRAQAWWQQLKQRRVRHGKEKISNWVKFKKHIRAAFLPYNFERELYQRFQNLRQGSRSVDAIAEAHQRASQAEKQLARRGTSSFRQPTNSTSITGSSSQSARENSSQPTHQPIRGSAAPSHGRIGGLQCFNGGEVRHRETDYENLKFTNHGLFTKANELDFTPLADSSPTYDDYADHDAEEYISSDVGPLLVLRESVCTFISDDGNCENLIPHHVADCCKLKSTNRGLFTEAEESNPGPLADSSPIYDDYDDVGVEEYVRDVDPLLVLRGSVCAFISDSDSCETGISEVAVSKLNLMTESHSKPYCFSWLSQDPFLATTANSKADVDQTRRDIHFDLGDFVWAIPTKDRFHALEYNKLVATKIGLVKIVAKFKPHVYRLRVISHIRTSDVFNMTHLVPLMGDSSSDEGDTARDSRTNLSMRERMMWDTWYQIRGRICSILEGMMRSNSIPN